MTISSIGVERRGLAIRAVLTRHAPDGLVDFEDQGGGVMGGTGARSWRKVLHEALNGYREREAQGGDMAGAGAELARAVERLLIPPPCSPPRDVLLRDTASLTDYGG